MGSGDEGKEKRVDHFDEEGGARERERERERSVVCPSAGSNLGEANWNNLKLLISYERKRSGAVR